MVITKTQMIQLYQVLQHCSCPKERTVLPKLSGENYRQNVSFIIMIILKCKVVLMSSVTHLWRRSLSYRYQINVLVFNDRDVRHEIINSNAGIIKPLHECMFLSCHVRVSE